MTTANSIVKIAKTKTGKVLKIAKPDENEKAVQSHCEGSENEKMKIKGRTSDSTDANATNSQNPW